MITFESLFSIFFENINYETYLRFLEHNQKLVNNQIDYSKDVNEEYHIHHIIPKYWFKENFQYLSLMNTPQNLIKLTKTQHIIAHRILFKLNKDRRDLGAIFLLQGATKEGMRLYRQLGARAVHKHLKKTNKGFWNRRCQKENAAKSLAKPTALQTRSLGGKKGGYKRNMNLIVRKESQILFYFDKTPFLCIFNCQTGGDIVKILNYAKPTSLKRITSVLKGERKKAYKWSCIWLKK